MRSTVAAFAVGVALGGLGLFALGLADAEAADPEPEPRIIERTRVVSQPYEGPSLAAIRETLRAEMAAAAVATSAEVAGTEAPIAIDPEREAEAAAAYADATELLDDAFARGVWSDEDAAALRSRLGRMDEGQIDETLRTLAVAINAQQLSVTTAGAPF